MEKLITKIALFRIGVNLFEAEVNANLADGWKIKEISIEKRGLRIICYAVLMK